MNIHLVCNQVIELNGNKTTIGFEKSEITELKIDKFQLELWAGLNLFHWFNLQKLQNQQAFKLKTPIRIEIFIDEKSVSLLMQRRVTKDSIVKDWKNFLIPLDMCEYMLIPYKEKKIGFKKSKNVSEEQTVNDFNYNKMFNTVEYFNCPPAKYGSPVIYTGWIN